MVVIAHNPLLFYQRVHPCNPIKFAHENNSLNMESPVSFLPFCEGGQQLFACNNPLVAHMKEDSVRTV